MISPIRMIGFQRTPRGGSSMFTVKIIKFRGGEGKKDSVWVCMGGLADHVCVSLSCVTYRAIPYNGVLLSNCTTEEKDGGDW